jgi:ADP-ribosyl-[dinitrogen reductase] hydrolase
MMPASDQKAEVIRMPLFAQTSAARSGPASLLARAEGAYLGLAVGDALGATVEFMTPREIAHHHGVHREIRGGGWLRLRRGQVTDDTEMALALGDSILQQGQVEPFAVAEAFSHWMRHKPVDIGNTVRRGIVHYRTTGECRVPPSENDAGNGACMRCLPVALAYLGATPEQLALASQQQAHVTHHSAVADAGTLTVLRMIQAALLGEGLTALHALADALVAEQRAYRFDRRRMENPSAYLGDTLKAVFQALFSTAGFEAGLVDVVNRGGDADTTGAILGMILGALHGRAAIPRRWLMALEADIREQCLDQARGLIALAPSLRAAA